MEDRKTCPYQSMLNLRGDCTLSARDDSTKVGSLPEYGQSFWIMLMSSGGVSAVKYGGASSGMGGNTFRSFEMDAAAASGAFGKVDDTSSSSAELSRDKLSCIPHWSLWLYR